jgi:hypothetical protein
MSQTPEPAPSILDRLLDPIGRAFTPDGAQRLVALQADPTSQARLQALADTCTEAQLSPEERTEYETYARAIECIAVLQAKARRLLVTVAPDGSSAPQLRKSALSQQMSIAAAADFRLHSTEFCSTREVDPSVHRL